MQIKTKEPIVLVQYSPITNKNVLIHFITVNAKLTSIQFSTEKAERQQLMAGQIPIEPLLRLDTLHYGFQFIKLLLDRVLVLVQIVLLLP